MRVIYIAGAYRAPNAWLIEQNIRRAEQLALEVAAHGAAPLCPHANTRFFQGTMTDEFWLAATMELLRRCDAVILVNGWEYSSGTRAEIEEAHRIGKLVFSNLDDLAEWLDEPKEGVPPWRGIFP